MRLLLDEMYPAVIAEQLQRVGHDVEAITARPELRSLTDPDVFTAAQQERRAIVTENVVDFSAIADGFDQKGQAHHGVVFVDGTKFPRGRRRRIGRVVKGLEVFLRDNPGEAPTSLRHWL